ncbi:hypothetical protein I547_6986 [Mycobacterium kansasii 824]|uniref:Uncharacterized protein n=1 Tax=Mycobacterium kansasii TaxID=1768 RepID=A0A1V3X278_MYCKA|nr:hypothetical protein I547_6986 [Mycobacterium kansasii 824]OOK72946.1 hypothetical protein BZL29_4851 [Mycobacterium kansasii]OOK75622.1 hypothetical protein BZL30_3151 [Mycobacterium kansasii]
MGCLNIFADACDRFRRGLDICCRLVLRGCEHAKKFRVDG